MGILANTHITLTADITIQNADCALDGYLRSSGGSGVTVDGQGLFGITSSCAHGRILGDEGTESVTLTGLTHFDGGHACDVGGGIAAVGPVTATNSSFSNDLVTGACACGTGAVATCSARSDGFVHSEPFLGWLGGAIYSDAAVTLDHSTFTSNHADTAGGAVYAVGDVVSTGSTFSANSAGQSGEVESYLWGGAIAGESSITVDSSTFDGNFIGDSGGTCVACIIAGGAIAQSSEFLPSSPTLMAVTVTNSTFDDNHADCVSYCETEGGAVFGPSVTTSGSSFQGNSTNLGNCDLYGKSEFCASAGGAVAGSVLTDTGSTFSANHSDGAGCAKNGCYNEGGAIAAPELSLTGSKVTDNTANCETDCAAYGGGVVAGQDVGQLFPGSASAAASAAASSFKGADGPHPTNVRAASVLGAVSITQSDFAGNSAVCDTGECGASGGGALFLTPISVDISASTFSGNTAFYGGASAVFEDGDVPVTITNSTVTGNTSSFGGALGMEDSNIAVTLAYDTIVGNIVGAVPAGVTSAGSWSKASGQGAHAETAVRPANLSNSQLTSFGTIVGLPLGGPNCDITGDASAVTSQGYNWTATRRAGSPTRPTRWPGPTTRSSTRWVTSVARRPRCCLTRRSTVVSPAR